MTVSVNRVIRFKDIKTSPLPLVFLYTKTKYISSLQYFFDYNTLASKYGVANKEALSIVNPILNQLNLPEYEY